MKALKHDPNWDKNLMLNYYDLVENLNILWT